MTQIRYMPSGMRDFREIVDLPPTVLNLKDLEELEKILIEGLLNHPERLRVRANRGVSSYKSETLELLLNGHQLEELDSITFEVTGWTQSHDIDRGITVSLQPWWSNFQIHAHDETWFRGKKEQICQFFRLRRAWFARGVWRAVQPLLFFSPGPLIVATGVLAITRFFLAACFSGIALAVVAVALIAKGKGKIFRHSKIVLTSRERVITLESVTCVATVVACVLALASFIVQLTGWNLGSGGNAGGTQAQVPAQTIRFEEIRDRWNKLKGRFREQDEFLTECAGKMVDWIVVYDHPALSGGEDVMIFFRSPGASPGELVSLEAPVGGAVFPSREKERVYSLKTGDVIELQGTLTRLGDSLMVKGNSFHLAAADAKR